MSKTIYLDRLSKIEGHARLKVVFDAKKVTEARMEVFEGAQFYEAMVRGRPCTEIPITTARICGFCSQGHQNTAIAALENAMQIIPSPQTKALRELLQIAQTLSSHALHLYFLALPDYLGFSSAIQMASKYPAEVKRALKLKHVSTELCSAFGGREIHAITPAIGGFRNVPTKAKLEVMLEAVKDCKSDAIETARLFGKLECPKFERPTEYVALHGAGYSLMEGAIVSSPCMQKNPKAKGRGKNVCVVVPPNEVGKHLKEHLVDYSTAKHATFDDKTYMVGSLARVNINYDELSESTKQVAQESGISFPNYSPFTNNYAQALEMVQFHDRAIELLEQLIPSIKQEPLHALEFSECSGAAVTEVPRGILLHEYSLDAHGRITKANIVTPTAQNLRNIEEDIKKFLPPIAEKPKAFIVTELEKLVRAYDPCISCASHFLELDIIRDGGTDGSPLRGSRVPLPKNLT